MYRLLDHLIAYDDIDSSAWRGQLDFLRSDASARSKRVVLYTMNAERLFESALASTTVHVEVRKFMEWSGEHEEEEDGHTDSDSDSDVDMDDDSIALGSCTCFTTNTTTKSHVLPPVGLPVFTSDVPAMAPTEGLTAQNQDTAIASADHDRDPSPTVQHGTTSDAPAVADMDPVPSVGFADLPVELGLTVVNELPFKDRACLATTSVMARTLTEDVLQSAATKILLHFHLRFYMIRLLLTATGAAISGSAVAALVRVQDVFCLGDLDFVVGTGLGPAVVDFIILGSQYRLQDDCQVVNTNGIYCIWILIMGDLRIKVMECISPNPLDAITASNLTCICGAWLAEGLWHGYPLLTERGVALANPARFAVPDTALGRRTVWAALHKYLDRGFTIHLDELDAPHKCGFDRDCPSTLRFSDDAGCAFSRFPSWDYSIDTIELPRTCWTLGGSGCRRGTLTVNGQNVWIASASSNAVWLSDMQRLLAASTPPL